MKPFHANWREPEQYPPENCKNNLWLAWEFLRRCPRYAADVEQMFKLGDGEYHAGIKKTSNTVLDSLECWPPALTGETAQAYFLRLKGRSRWRQGRIAKPCHTFLNRWSLEDPVDPSVPYTPELVKFVPSQVRLKGHAILQTRYFPLFLYPNEVAVRFRLDLHLPQQLGEAQVLLEDAAERFQRALAEDANREYLARLPLVSNKDARLRDVHEKAHLWLRSYDAASAYEAGETEVRSFFNAERAKVSGSNKKPIQKGGVDAWCNSADTYINQMKFLILLQGEVVSAARKKKKKRSEKVGPDFTELQKAMRDMGR